MGFLDKMKHFMGGHGVKVKHTQVEKQDPTSVRLPLNETVVKGKFQVTAEKECHVLSMKSSMIMEVKHPDGRVENVVLGEDVFPSPNVSRSDGMLKYPYTLAAGGTQDDFFIISMPSSIPKELEKRKLSLGGPVRFFVKTMVDVEGSPFDPEEECPITIDA